MINVFNASSSKLRTWDFLGGERVSDDVVSLAMSRTHRARWVMNPVLFICGRRTCSRRFYVPFLDYQVSHPIPFERLQYIIS